MSELAYTPDDNFSRTSATTPSVQNANQAVQNHELRRRIPYFAGCSSLRPLNPEPEMDQELEQLLRPTAPTPQRLEGLLRTLRPAEIARYIGITVSGLRKWVSGQAEPRDEHAVMLDDLRDVAWILADGGLSAEEIGAWLRSRNPDLDRERPLDVLGKRPLDVSAAAHEPWLRQRDKELSR